MAWGGKERHTCCEASGGALFSVKQLSLCSALTSIQNKAARQTRMNNDTLVFPSYRLALKKKKAAVPMTGWSWSLPFPPMYTDLGVVGRSEEETVQDKKDS